MSATHHPCQPVHTRLANDLPHQIRRPSSVHRPVLSVATRLLNPLIRKVVGSTHVRQFALVYHRGRQSGRAYVTPVGARATLDGFIIPLTFGEGADWIQNVQAAGGCIIQWNGTQHFVVNPVTVDWMVARPAFHRIERTLIPMLGITQFVQVRKASGAPHDSDSH